MPSVYILHSQSIDCFYIGATSTPVEVRIDKHMTKYYDHKFTSRADDWTLYFEFECESMGEAMFIERHIKKMKSKKYIADLKIYPQIIESLKKKFRAPDS